MTVQELRALLVKYPADAEVKLCVLTDGSIGGADMSIEPSEDWPNAIVIFAEKEEAA